MLEGVITTWFVLTILSVAFIIYDLIKTDPEAGVMKLAWMLVVLYTGPIGLFFYFMTCREPLPHTHEEFVRPMWKQAIGSEVHCLAGDATGIIAAALFLVSYNLPQTYEIFFEYLAGLFFGLFVFQALFMRKMHGGNYFRAIKNIFYSEWVSMNFIMAGMIPVMVIWRFVQPVAQYPQEPYFWAMISFAVLVGGVVAYPVNYWLVSKGLKHGAMTVRKDESVCEENRKMVAPEVTGKQKRAVLFASLIALGLGVILATIVDFITR